MRKKIAILLALILMISTTLIPSYMVSNNATERLIVLYEDEVFVSRAATALARAGVLVEPFNIINGMVVHANERAILNITEGMGIVSIEPDQEVYALVKPTKPIDPVVVLPQKMDWGIDALGANDVWNSFRGNGIDVAVIDTGIDLDHPDLRVLPGVTYVLRTRSADDDNGHGTHVAGIIAALDNTIGVVGVAPNANLYPVKVLNSKGSGYLSDVVKGIEWAIGNQMDVINMSLGADSGSSAMETVLEAAESAGIITVAAAGNDGTAVDFPGAYDSTLAVGAVDVSLKLAYFSSIGPQVDIVGPGVNVYSTYKGGTYKALSGTSMATPHLAGLAALYKQMNPGADLSAFRQALAGSSMDLGTNGKDVQYGWGFPDARKLIH